MLTIWLKPKLNHVQIKRYKMNKTDATIQFLKENPKNFIRITNISNDQLLGNKNIYLSDIPNEDLRSYAQFLSGNSNAELWIEHRIERGATNVKAPNVSGYKLVIEYQTKKQDDEKKMVIPENKPVEQPIQPVQPVYHAQPFLASPNQQFDVLSSPIVKTIRDIDEKKYKDLERSYEDLREDNKDLKAENRTLNNEVIALKTQVSTAEKEKELAILMEKMNKSSFLDSPAFQKLVEVAPDMVEKAMMAKVGTAPAPQALNSPNVSPIKKSLIDYIVSDCTDNEANYVGSVLELFDNANFMNELKEIITRYGTN